jgi:2-oxoisovalerate dehydrogenase E2 component (dihydrolipoyl transacylase)
MGIHVIKVPDVGEGIAEVELVAWYVKPGDAVVEDERLADVMTDKASVEIPCPVTGRVLVLGGEVGQMLAVGSELIRIEVGEAKVAAPAPSVAPAVRPSPAPAAPATAEPAPAPGAPTAPPVGTADRPIASPSVRRRAWELGVELKDVAPSGTAGRITHADVEAAAAARGSERVPTPHPAPAAAEALRDEEQTVKVIGLRRRIAMQMQEAKRRIPHFAYVEELDITEAEALRASLNQRWAATRGRLTLLPLLMRAMVLALAEFPQINARFDDETGVVTRHRAVHLGIATQTPNGLVVPVVRHAQALDLWAAATEVARLADAARAGRATRDELSGSTITISSLGALGGIVSTPIINRPEVAIVGVNRIVERPVVRGGAIVTRQTMNLSSSFDHRVVDGADAAAFIQAVRARLEQPALLFVE